MGRTCFRERHGSAKEIDLRSDRPLQGSRVEGGGGRAVVHGRVRPVPGRGPFVLNEAEMTLAPFLRDLELDRHRNSIHRTSSLISSRRLHPCGNWRTAPATRPCRSNTHAAARSDCEFCNITTLFGHNPRVKTSAQIINELDGLYKLGWREPVFFVDDNLIGNKKQLRGDLLPGADRVAQGQEGDAVQHRDLDQYCRRRSADEHDDPGRFRHGLHRGGNTRRRQPGGVATRKQNLHRDLVADVKADPSAPACRYRAGSSSGSTR